jgi:hypothetical protein
VSENDFWRGILLLVAYSLAYASRGEWDQRQIMIAVAVVNPLLSFFKTSFALSGFTGNAT